MDYSNFEIKQREKFIEMHETIKSLMDSNDINKVSEIKKTISDNEYLLSFKLKDEWDIDKRYPLHRIFLNDSGVNKECEMNRVKGHNCSEISHRETIYSNLSRVLGSIDYIVKGECEPLDVIEINNQYFIVDGKHRYTAHLLLNQNTFPANVEVLDYKNEISKYILIKDFDGKLLFIRKTDILEEVIKIPSKRCLERKSEYVKKVENALQLIWDKLKLKKSFGTMFKDDKENTWIEQFEILEIEKKEFTEFIVEKVLANQKELEFKLLSIFWDIEKSKKNHI